MTDTKSEKPARVAGEWTCVASTCVDLLPPKTHGTYAELWIRTGGLEGNAVEAWRKHFESSFSYTAEIMVHGAPRRQSNTIPLPSLLAAMRNGDLTAEEDGDWTLTGGIPEAVLRPKATLRVADPAPAPPTDPDEVGASASDDLIVGARVRLKSIKSTDDPSTWHRGAIKSIGAGGGFYEIEWDDGSGPSWASRGRLALDETVSATAPVMNVETIEQLRTTLFGKFAEKRPPSDETSPSDATSAPRERPTEATKVVKNALYGRFGERRPKSDVPWGHLEATDPRTILHRFRDEALAAAQEHQRKADAAKADVARYDTELEKLGVRTESRRAEHRDLFLQVVKSGASEAGIRLAAQLLGFAPCPKCDHCADVCGCPKTEASAAPVAATPAPSTSARAFKVNDRVREAEGSREGVGTITNFDQGDAYVLWDGPRWGGGYRSPSTLVLVEESALEIIERAVLGGAQTGDEDARAKAIVEILTYRTQRVEEMAAGELSSGPLATRLQDSLTTIENKLRAPTVAVDLDTNASDLEAIDVQKNGRNAIRDLKSLRAQVAGIATSIGVEPNGSAKETLVNIRNWATAAMHRQERLVEERAIAVHELDITREVGVGQSKRLADGEAAIAKAKEDLRQRDADLNVANEHVRGYRTLVAQLYKELLIPAAVASPEAALEAVRDLLQLASRAKTLLGLDPATVETAIAFAEACRCDDSWEASDHTIQVQLGRAASAARAAYIEAKTNAASVEAGTAPSTATEPPWMVERFKKGAGVRHLHKGSGVVGAGPPQMAPGWRSVKFDGSQEWKSVKVAELTVVPRRVHHTSPPLTIAMRVSALRGAMLLVDDDEPVIVRLTTFDGRTLLGGVTKTSIEKVFDAGYRDPSFVLDAHERDRSEE